jgi:translation initiation factor 3 subunit A
LENLDTDKLKALQVQQLEKERKDLQLKSKMLIKRYDHIERAYRKTEINRLLEDYENQKKLDKENFQAKCKADIESSKQQYEKDMEMKNRLKVMHADYLSYKSGIMKKREEAFKIKKAEMDKKLEEAKKKRIEEYTVLRLEQEKKKEEEAAVKAEQESKFD